MNENEVLGREQVSKRKLCLASVEAILTGHLNSKGSLSPCAFIQSRRHISDQICPMLRLGTCEWQLMMMVVYRCLGCCKGTRPC